ncbi:unnamed protein product [Microthlaspi erraticum]|nr:unnamed protein product [Microthlaspi erraticum]
MVQTVGRVLSEPRIFTALSLFQTATIALLLIAFLQNAAAEKRIQRIVKHHGAVATDDGRCSDAGVMTLRGGENAVDAAVAAAFCLGVLSPASSGIGGGAFMLVKEAGGKEIANDSRETAPLKATENMNGGKDDLKKQGGLSVVSGLFAAWKRHGKLPWKKLIKPAEKLASKGFEISRYLHMQMNATRGAILADKGLSDLLVSNGELKKPEIGFDLEADRRSYRVKVKEPLSADILGYRLLGMPPPSSGGAAMMLVLRILSLYGIPSGVSGPLGVHRLVEALKHAFAVRMNLGDPDFVDVTKVVSDMLSPKFAKGLKKKINDEKTFDPKHYGGK